MTGLGVKLTSLIISLSDNNIWPALILTGIACLLLGMGATTAAYVICVSVAGPALVDMGLELLSSSLICIYFCLVINNYTACLWYSIYCFRYGI